MVQDIALQDFDIAVRNGDMVTAESDQQHIELLLRTNKGDWKQSPITGVNIAQYIKGRLGLTEANQLKRTIALQLQYDGYISQNVNIGNNAEITVDTKR